MNDVQHNAVQHSAASAEWGTPLDVLERIRRVCGQIDLDPCSSATFASNVQATRFFTKTDNGLIQDWSARTVFINPPGNKPHEESMPAAFWGKLEVERSLGHFAHAFWIGFTLEHLRSTQAGGILGLLAPHVTLCVPRARLRFLRPDGTEGKAPGHANVIAYVRGIFSDDLSSCFKDVFSEIGAVR